jgi:hypothetical protein
VFYNEEAHEFPFASSSVSRVTADSTNGIFRFLSKNSVVKTYSYFLKSVCLIPYHKEFLFSLSLSLSLIISSEVLSDAES